MELSKKISNFESILRNRNFLFLWMGQIFSQLADKIIFVLGVALLASLTQNPEKTHVLYVGLILAFSLPAIFFGAFAGVFVDRWSRKYIMVISNLVRGGLLLLIPFWNHNPIYLYLLIFLISVFMQVFAPAETATIPSVVRKDDLMSANSLFTLTMMLAIIFGFALGDPVINIVGLDWSFMAVAAMYFLSAAFLLLLPDLKGKLQLSASSKAFFGEDFKSGVRYIVGNSMIWSSFLRLVLLYSTLTALMVLAIGFAEKFGLESKSFGYLIAPVGIGIAIGAWITGRFGTHIPKGWVIGLSFIALGITLITFGFETRLTHGLGFAFLLGIEVALIAVPVQTSLQAIVPEHLRGKVFGAQNTLVNIASTFPMAIVGVLADYFGGQKITLALGGIIIVLSLLLSLIPWKERTDREYE